MHADSDDLALILSGVEILQELEVEAISDIARQVKFVDFSRGQMLTKKGQPGTHLYIIFKGLVEVHIPSPSGQKSKRITLRKGSIVGEMSMLTGKSYSADVVALSDTTAMYLQRNQFLELIKRHTSFAESMSALMSERIAQNGEINRVGKYDVLYKLGEGAMAVVFNAYDKELEREVAIKMLKYELAYDPEFLKRFEREAKVIASLQHPHIVNVIEIIKEFSTSFIVMEKLEGENLADVIEKEGSFTQDRSCGILVQIANALQYAHKQGIVHRDIKPANIMMDSHGHIKLTDFGVSGPPQDKDVNIEGTPYFLAPEVISGKMVDGRADIYAMGVTAFYMLTNTLPFVASTIEELHSKQLNQPIPDIRKLCAGISLEVITFISGLLTSEPDNRLQDWEEIKTILGAGGDSPDSSLGYDEIELIIRMNQISLEQSQEVIKTIRKILKDRGVVHAIEMEQGSIDISL